ncbi:hypothetical protein CLSA_c42830 [Clostridium saccharobutylicum DSM 13864]|uniref:Uncharacterized protein n=1 Tax=Clostridium saccharobutylicum DSM 13864 TaxID=1345695 RepID=U5MXG7_CLOSA|nr:hypothetical protein CLSA_c42830 [Clostridium saccharobutylicum DSM 13864]
MEKEKDIMEMNFEEIRCFFITTLSNLFFMSKNYKNLMFDT